MVKHADILNGYADYVDETRVAVRACLSAANSNDCTGSEILQNYEYARMNLSHALNITDEIQCDEMASRVIEELMINRNIDHVPLYAPALADYIDIHDPAGVLSEASLKQPHIFAGFHTGPYWSIIIAILKGGGNATVLYPSWLAHKRDELIDTYRALKEYTRFRGEMNLLEIDGPRFLLHVKKCISEARQLVLYIDGHTPLTNKLNARHDVELRFFDCSIRVKSTIAVLSKLLRVPLVTFNARRSDGLLRNLYCDEPIDVDKYLVNSSASYADLVGAMFRRLATSVSSSVPQWEGWIYMHTYLSHSYLSSIRQSTLSSEVPAASLKSRVFTYVLAGQRYIVDKATYQTFRLKA